MQFLNDKFFRVAVILFFLLMALPFMFSEPQPEKKDNTPALEFEDKNPVYNILNKIAKFYGLKKQEKDKQPVLIASNLANIKKQIAQRKEPPPKQPEELKQDINIEKKDNPSNEVKTTSATKDLPLNNIPYQKTATFANFNNEEFEVLQDKPGKEDVLRPKNSLPLQSLPKTSNKNIHQKIIEPGETKNTSIYTETKDIPAPYLKQISQEQETKIISSGNKKSYQKGSFNNYFKASTKIGKDFLDNIDNNIRHIQLIKQNKTAQNKDNTKSSYTKTYRTQIFNTSKNKQEVISVQKQIDQENLKNAQIVKKITAESLGNKTYNDTTYTDKDGNETPFPSKEEQALLKPGIPPHTLFNYFNSADIYKSFDASYNKALHTLPNKTEDYPFLEFVYGNKDNEILRAPNDSFNVLAISKILADKVSLPLGQRNIDFLDTKKSIYVVPQENLYKEYVSMNIPVIYYPDLSPENLGKAYETANKAIEVLNSNKTEQQKNEQKQNKTEIENLLKKE